jgi:hypothetical protein
MSVNERRRLLRLGTLAGLCPPAPGKSRADARKWWPIIKAAGIKPE